MTLALPKPGLLLSCLVLLVLFEPAGGRQSRATTSPHPTEVSPVIHHATGSFEPVLTPAPLADANASKTLGRMILSKQFHGGLEATSRGEMLSARTATKGSAGYVAIEQVTGILDGRSGAFTLMHFATMDRGTPSLRIVIVPDSGSGQLTGISGSMTINIAPEGRHTYDLAYTLPST